MKGFTLIEFMVIITIIGILSAVALPAFNSAHDSIKMEGAYKQLAQDIRYVQQIAVARQVPCGIVFDPSGETYFAYSQNTSNIVKDPATQRPYSISYTSGKFSGIDLAGTTFLAPSADTVEFDAHGRPVGAGSVTISYKGITRAVSVEENTGRLQ